MAEAIKLFSKSLTETDTRKRLAIPAKILPDLPEFHASHAVNLNLSYGTKMWPIVCTVRKNGYKKPVFSGGWRNFVICNHFSVGDELTLYKVYDEAGSSYYRVEVAKPLKPCRVLPPLDVSNLTESPNMVEYQQSRSLFKADAPKKEEGAVMVELAYVADHDIVSVPVVDHVSSKPPCWLFGNNLSEEPARLKTDMKFNGNIAMCIDEPPLHSCYNRTKEEKEINFIDLYSECVTLDSPGQPAQYAGEVNLDLTLAPLTRSTSLC